MRAHELIDAIIEYIEAKAGTEKTGDAYDTRWKWRRLHSAEEELDMAARDYVADVLGGLK